MQYVIGSPLNVELSHTITKGILSAKRTADSLDFYQTDAAINFGNSGGPIFDAQGELIAIAVASLNINYLIPIDSAFKRLKITKTGSVEAILTNEAIVSNVVSAISTQEDEPSSLILKLIYFIDGWLDKPFFSRGFALDCDG